MLPLPLPTQDPNLLALARVQREERTGVAGATWQLTSKPVSTLLFVWKNGLLLSAAVDYSVSADTITFTVPLIAGDVTVAMYWARAS